MKLTESDFKLETLSSTRLQGGSQDRTEVDVSRRIKHKQDRSTKLLWLEALTTGSENVKQVRQMNIKE